jgi:hypothetical protein
MIEPNRDSSRSDEHCHTVPDNHGAWMINLEAPSAEQLDREHPKRLSLSQFLKDVLEIVSRHDVS